MTVYVDDMRMKAQFFRWRGTWSNLWADTTKELIDFADEIGLSPSSAIDLDYVTERYLITETKRQAAIELGAVPIEYAGATMYKIVRRKRQGVTRSRSKSGRWKEK